MNIVYTTQCVTEFTRVFLSPHGAQAPCPHSRVAVRGFKVRAAAHRCALFHSRWPCKCLHNSGAPPSPPLASDFALMSHARPIHSSSQQQHIDARYPTVTGPTNSSVLPSPPLASDFALLSHTRPIHSSNTQQHTNNHCNNHTNTQVESLDSDLQACSSASAIRVPFLHRP